MDPVVSPETQAVVPGSDDHNALMVEKFDSQNNSEVNTQRPSWLPEKFNSPEDLAAAYAALEKKQSTATHQQAPVDPQTANLDQAREAVAGAGVDFDALSDEFAATGELSDESYAALEAKGFPRDLVDSFIEGQVALANQFQNSVTADVGGMEAYAEIIGWAAQNLTPAEIDAFNETVDSGNLTKAKLAVQGLKARYDAAVGTDPQLLGGDTTGTAGDVFRSTAELTAAMKDPRYKKDPAYREDVKAKLGRSNIY